MPIIIGKIWCEPNALIIYIQLEWMTFGLGFVPWREVQKLYWFGFGLYLEFVDLIDSVLVNVFLGSSSSIMGKLSLINANVKFLRSLTKS